MLQFRRRIGNSWVVATSEDDGRTWQVQVTDALSKPVTAEERHQAIREAQREVDSLRDWLWHHELGHPKPNGT